jgi:ATP-binding cassette subfamily F protein 3
MQILAASGVTFHYGERRVLSDVGFKLLDDGRIGIVGPNGSGKTSLLRLILGELEPDEGSLDRMRGLRLGYVPQIGDSSSAGTLRDEIMGAFRQLSDLERSLTDPAEPDDAETGATARERYESLLAMYDSLGGTDHVHVAERTAAQVGLSGKALDTPSTVASGGERTRAALARALLSDPDLLLLDEPTNYLDFQALDWLEGFLSKSRRAFVVVSHDRYFLDRVTRETWEISRARLTVYPGPYSRYRALKAEWEERQRREYEKQQEFLAKEREFIGRNRAGQNARQARGRETRLARLELTGAPQAERTVRLERALQIPRSGNVVLTTDALRVSVTEDDGTVRQLLEVPDITLRRGSRTCIIGPNGSGKTTLVHNLLGLIQPLAGTASLGEGVRPGFLKQELGDLPERATAMEALIEMKQLNPEDARSYLARFLFQGDDVSKRVSVLSGGERARLAIARLLLMAPNLLVLDEPTTHLDIASRDAIEAVLLEYQGTLLVVSHDRTLVSTLAEQLWITEDGSLTVFPEGFEEWTGSRKAQSSHAVPAVRAHAPTNRRELRRQRAEATRPHPAEKTIARLEERLTELHDELEKASVDANVAAITRLGKEYTRVQSDLEAAWVEWAE